MMIRTLHGGKENQGWAKHKVLGPPNGIGSKNMCQFIGHYLVFNSI